MIFNVIHLFTSLTLMKRTLTMTEESDPFNREDFAKILRRFCEDFAKILRRFCEDFAKILRTFRH